MKSRWQVESVKLIYENDKAIEDIEFELRGYFQQLDKGFFN